MNHPAIFAALALVACHAAPAVVPSAPAVYARMPLAYHTTDDMALAPNGDILLAIPNFNNPEMVAQGFLSAPAPAVIAAVGPSGEVRPYYTFKAEDLHPTTGKVGPMGIEFGPDGHVYFIDRQIAYDPNYKTRIARIRVENGTPTRMEVLVDGSIGANDLAWRGNTLYVTETVAIKSAKGAPTVSGVYAFPLAELERGLVHLRPFRSDDDHDPHQIVTFRSNGKMGSGADGIAFDDAGRLYTAVIEEGAIYRTEIDANDHAGATTLFAQGAGIVSADGLTFDRTRQRFYLADFLGNAVHAIDLDGKVTTLQKNGDRDASQGDLDQPCATLLVGDTLVVSNMDYASAAPGLSVNTRVDRAHALTALRLAR